MGNYLFFITCAIICGVSGSVSEGIARYFAVGVLTFCLILYYTADFIRERND